MPGWVPQYKVRRSNRILDFAVRQNAELLNVAGEAVYLLKRKARAVTTYQWDSRKVDTITETAIAGSYTVDPDTGMLRYCLWTEATDPATSYPDIGTLTVTVQASGMTTVWEAAVDKYSFITGEEEYAVDIFQDQIDSTGADIPDSVYIVFNTPPFHAPNIVLFTFGYINPLVNFAGMQPIRDNQATFQNSLYGFEQWLSPNARIRRKITPNAFLLAFPGITADFTITEAGLLQESKGAYWTNPPMVPNYPDLVEHDIIVRDKTTERFQIINVTKIIIENLLVSVQFDMSLLDPRSSLYSIPIIKGN